MDYISSFFWTPTAKPEIPDQPRLPEFHPEVPDTSTAAEIALVVAQYRLVAIICWASSTYDELSAQQEIYDQFLQTRSRCHEDFMFFKADVDNMIREEAGVPEPRETEEEIDTRRKRGERKVRGVLGVHPKVVRKTAAVSVYKRGVLVGSIEGDEMDDYGIIEKALNSVIDVVEDDWE